MMQAQLGVASRALLWLAAALQDQRGVVNLGQLLGIIGSVVILVVGLVLFPIVSSSVATTIQDPNIDYFTGAGPLIRLVPLLYAVGTLGMAAAVALYTFRVHPGQ